MSSFTVTPSGLQSAGQSITPAADGLDGINVPAPNVQMYGELVGSAATDAEPATTTALNGLADALSMTVASIGTRLDDNATCYLTTEDDNGSLSTGIDVGVVI